MASQPVARAGEICYFTVQSYVRLSDKFSCGKTQISTLMKNKEIELFESNAPGISILLSKRSHPSDFCEINEALYKWYSLATSRNIYPVGPQLCEKAKQIAEKLTSWHRTGGLIVGRKGIMYIE